MYYSLAPWKPRQPGLSAIWRGAMCGCAWLISKAKSHHGPNSCGYRYRPAGVVAQQPDTVTPVLLRVAVPEASPAGIASQRYCRPRTACTKAVRNGSRQIFAEPVSRHPLR